MHKLGDKSVSGVWDVKDRLALNVAFSLQGSFDGRPSIYVRYPVCRICWIFIFPLHQPLDLGDICFSNAHSISTSLEEEDIRN